MSEILSSRYSTPETNVQPMGIAMFFQMGKGGKRNSTLEVDGVMHSISSAILAFFSADTSQVLAPTTFLSFLRKVCESWAIQLPNEAK